MLTPMAKLFVGARLRRLRDERGLSQAALARQIELSTSYVNQLENDQRPITVPVLLTLTREFDLGADYFAADPDARLVADLSDAMRVTLRDGTDQIVQRIARLIEAGVSDGSIPALEPAATAQTLYQMWLGASLLGKLHRNSDALNNAMQFTQKLLTR